MRKFIFALVLGVVALIVIPSCSTADSLEDVIEESDFDISASTDDAESKVAKPGAK